MTEPLLGLVLAGGQSRRMQYDKALIAYHGTPQLLWTYRLVASLCRQTFISVRPDQHDKVRDNLPRIEDSQPAVGPASGLLAAAGYAPGKAWLVVACDLPYLSSEVLQHLVRQRDPQRPATAFRSVHDGLPEPLCAIWEPAGLDQLSQQVAAGRYCPRKTLAGADIRLLAPLQALALENVNTPAERDVAIGDLS